MPRNRNSIIFLPVIIVLFVALFEMAMLACSVPTQHSRGQRAAHEDIGQAMLDSQHYKQAKQH